MSDVAYLVIREGTKWSDVFRLMLGDAIRIGRDPSNQIVIKDERSSRTHAELFMLEERWMLRDLGSRNGTAVGKKLIKGDWWTPPTKLKTDAKGRTTFRGHLGTYRLRTESGFAEFVVLKHGTAHIIVKASS